jgi:DNA-binding CsgD family transcriptional regulator
MDVEDIYHLLATDAGADACWEGTRSYLENLGLDRIIHICMDAGADAPRVRTTMPGSFQTHYVEQGYGEDDPFLHYCLPSAVPIDTGKAHMDQYLYLTDRQKDLIAAAGEVGFNAGFSIATRFPSARGTEGWNLGSTLSCREVSKIRDAHMAQIRPLLFALRGQLMPLESLPALSARERQCLELLSNGLRIKAIAEQLGIKPVTVDMHLSNARKKMNAPTTKNLLRKYWESRLGA